MSQTFQCGDNTALVGYLYDECDTSERRAIEAHLAMCAACAAEVAALGSTRLQLASWAPPDTQLGFQIIRPRTSGLGAQTEGWRAGPRLWKQPLPAWAQAAAACVIFGAGLWLGIARGTAPRQPGSGQADAQPAAVVATTPATAANMVSAAELASLEQRLRNEIAQIRAASTTPAAPQSLPEAQWLARVRALIDESEQRQQRELARGMTQVMRDFETQRRVDLAQIQGTFRQMEGVTGAQVREQRDVLNYLMRVSQQGR